jgi:hypothetical protein
MGLLQGRQEFVGMDAGDLLADMSPFDVPRSGGIYRVKAT